MPQLIPSSFHQTMRSQYELVWEQNKFTIALVKEGNKKARDFYHETETVDLTVEVLEANIQYTTQQTTLENRGYHDLYQVSAYYLHEAPIEFYDWVIWNGQKWKIDSEYIGYYQGKRIYIRSILRYISDLKPSEITFLTAQGVPAVVFEKV